MKRPIASALYVSLASAALAALSPSAPARACTTFLLQEGPQVRVGKSYDWDLGQGLVLFNKRGVAKRAVALRPTDQPAQWVSRYASLTFNQYGREFPNGGMNQAGLVVEIMWLSGSQYPPADARPALGELPWIQYQLDNYATVAEAVAHAQDVRVSNQYGKVHYLVCDRGGACASFEHLGGKLVVHAGAELPVKVLTNHTYEDSLSYLGRVAPCSKGPAACGAPKAPSGPGSLERFARTALAAGGPAPKSGGAGADLDRRALGMLDGVNVGPQSRWNIVYDPVGLRVAFRTGDRRALRTVDLKAFDGSCATPVRMLDMQAALSGDVTAAFQDYREEANANLVRATTAPIATQLPPGALEQLVAYPSRLACARP